MNLSFNGVEEAINNEYTKPGVAVFTISGMEFKEGNEGKNGFLEISFLNEEGQFKHKFFLTEKALPRVKHLMLNCGLSEEQIIGITSTDAIQAALTGKKVRLVVDGESFNSKEGNNIVTYATLAFSGFAEQVSTNPSKLRNYKTIDKTEKKIDVVGTTQEAANNKMPWDE